MIARQIFLPVIGFLVTLTSVSAETPWTQWRGAEQNGVAPQGDFPTQWSEESGVAWKTELPGRGGSTPIVVESQAFLTWGTGTKNQLGAIRTSDGEINWVVDLGEDRGGKHKKGSGANPSAVSDGRLVVAYFRSGDLGCVDLSGTLQWKVNLQSLYGDDTLWWDLGSSPLIVDDLVVVAVMQTGPSYLIAFDKATGEVRWKQDRDVGAPKEAAQSYSTPLAVTANEQPAIAVMGADHLTLHDRTTGEQIGILGGFNPTEHEFFRSIASPVAGGHVVVCPYARGETTTGVDMNALAKGATSEATLWHRDDLGSDVPTPAVSGGLVYMVSDGKQTRGTVTCVNLKDGKTEWTVETPKSRTSFTSSPLVAGNHLYVTNEVGTTFVIGPLDSDQPELVATNPLADDRPYTVASPVPVSGGFLIRTKKSLYRVGPVAGN